MENKNEIVNRSRCLSVVVPAFNEVNTIERIIERLRGVPNLLEIVIVDDHSSDGTPAVISGLLQKYDFIRSVRHESNQGKTAALRTGFAMTAGDIVIVQDADLEYDPAEIPEVIRPILEGFADVVYGSRFMVRRAARVLYFYHYLANKFLTFFSNAVTNLNITDVETCYKAFRGDIIRNMTISSTGFGFEIEVTAKVAKLNCVLYEVPISYYGRTYAEGKKITYRDGIAAMFYVVKYNLLTGRNSSFKSLPDVSRRGLIGNLDSSYNEKS
jgi:glycosyltransferase involved in cell wall biosynthesis